jgi:hypothetical protein
MKQNTGLKIIFGGCHMTYITQWLKVGGGKLFKYSGMQIFSQTMESQRE